MNQMNNIITQPQCNPDGVVQGEHYRFTVLTSQLIRLEYSKEGYFEDRPTQMVLNRAFPVPEFQIFEKDDSLELVTDQLHLIYDKKEFSKNGLSIQVKGNLSAYHSIWRFTEEATDLRGTARTLDEADGAISLEHGLISRNGYAVVDDSRSLLLTEDGWVAPREEGVIDFYFFGYGHDYQECLRDFYRLTGNTPLLPRYALGNWWSRFHKYTEGEYKGLMERFQAEKIPFSVAVIDIDWHLVDIDPKYGSGWTGYTWNRELFPQPKEFMSWLHDHEMKITLNVHPADGVRPHEEQYLEMAKKLDKDWEKEEKISFDFTSKEFVEAYFQYLHHPNEEDGVDFWWVDWQSGDVSKVPGLDPLWMLNHYHYLDSSRRGNRALTFSRYAGLGSHRYPLGFSGDTIISWESLDFQPYFTANASNAGYGWWSHDIGGHMMGRKDDELSVRWVQFGVFSPIMRLHSSSNLFSGKEPWKYNQIAETVMKKYLKLRHELIPYLYTCNRLASREGQPLIRPLYYGEPEQQEAYEVSNEYYFGTELIVCPITKPLNKKSDSASFSAWLPEGVWFDLFCGRVYNGGRRLALYRGIEDIPVMAKAGAILPMAHLEEYTNSVENPKGMTIHVFAGADGSFHLYEDEGNTKEDLDENWADTLLEFTWGLKPSFMIHAAQGNTGILPAERSYKVNFCGMTNGRVQVKVNGEMIDAISSYDDRKHKLTVEIPKVETGEEIEISLLEPVEIAGNDRAVQAFDYLERTELEYNLKEKIYYQIKDSKNILGTIAMLQSLGLEENVFGALCEILTAY